MHEWAFENLNREEYAQYVAWKKRSLLAHPPLAQQYDLIDLDALEDIAEDESSTAADLEYCAKVSRHIRDNPNLVADESYPRLPNKIYRATRDLLAAVAAVVVGEATKKDLSAFVNSTWVSPETELERDQVLAILARVKDGVVTADINYLRCLYKATQSVGQDWFTTHAARVAEAATQIATKCVF